VTRALKRRERRIAATLALSGVVLAIGAGVVWRNLPRPKPYLPGERVEGITDSLGRSLPTDYPRVQFTDVTTAAGLVLQPASIDRSTQLPEDMGSGAAWGDYDGDGQYDLYVVSTSGPLTWSPAQMAQSPAPSRLYHNQGDGTFKDVTESAGVGLRGVGMGAAWGDADGDGDPDLFVTQYGNNVLFRNNGDGTFTDVSAAAGVSGPAGFWSGASWADYDHDGDLDLYVCGYVRYHFDPADLGHSEQQYGSMTPTTLNPSAYPPERNLLYRNRGDGTFEEVAESVGVQNLTGRSLSATWADFNEDTWPDLYVANDVSDNALYVSQGDGTFRDASQEATVADYRGAMGLAIGDWDLDTDLDMFITHWLAQENALYVNLWRERHGEATGPGARTPKPGPTSAGGPAELQFMDVADRYGLGQIALDFVGFGTAFLDYDLDGREDLFVVNGSTLQDPDNPKQLVPMVNQLFWNRGEDGFFEVGAVSGAVFAEAAVGRGLAMADYDNDGDPDVVVVNHGAPPRLLRNDDGDVRHWLKVRLAGPAGGQGLGARITADVGTGQQVREIGAGSSYLSQNAPEAVFGLGDAPGVTALHVLWPDGTAQDVGAVTADQTIVVRKGAGWAPVGTPRADATAAIAAVPPTAVVVATVDRAQVQRFWDTYRQAVQAMKVDGDWQRSAELFRAALAINPDHEDSLYYLGNSLIELGDFPGALAQFEHLVTVSPQSHRGYLQIGALRALPAAGPLYDLGESQRALEKAVSINPEESGALLHLGAVRVALGDLAAASDDFAKARRLNPKALDAYYLDSYIHWKQGDAAAARDLLAQAVALSQPPTPTPGGPSGEGDTKKVDRSALVLSTVEARRLFADRLAGLKGQDAQALTTTEGMAREYAAVEAYIATLRR
jgi:enediyne biosynthesis protein E4